MAIDCLTIRAYNGADFSGTNNLAVAHFIDLRRGEIFASPEF